jgi:hypothetical protein
MPDLMRARDPDEVRTAMQARDLTFRELAKLADTTVGTTRFVVIGKATSRDVAIRIARTLRRRVDDLFVPAASSSKQPVDQQDTDKAIA